jgi:hypothetical protein
MEIVEFKASRELAVAFKMEMEIALNFDPALPCCMQDVT